MFTVVVCDGPLDTQNTGQTTTLSLNSTRLQENPPTPRLRHADTHADTDNA